MTNAEQPQDLPQRLASIEAQLEQLGDELDLIRTIQDGVRRETRVNSQTGARLERTVARLADIARDHQLALRTASEDAQRDRMAFREEIRQIWEHLQHQGGNGNAPSG